MFFFNLNILKTKTKQVMPTCIIIGITFDSIDNDYNYVSYMYVIM